MIANERHLKEFIDSTGTSMSENDIVVGYYGWRKAPSFFTYKGMYGSDMKLQGYASYNQAKDNFNSSTRWGEKISKNEFKYFTIINKHNEWQYKK